jgi:hypothetical protein
MNDDSPAWWEWIVPFAMVEYLTSMIEVLE